MRTAFAFALIFSFNVSAATIERLDPAAIPANSGAVELTIYGSELAEPVVFSTPAGEMEAWVSGKSEQWISVYVPLEAMMEPGETRITIADASAILKIIDPDPGPLQIQGGDPIVVAAEGRWGATVEYEVFVIGGRDPNPSVTCDPPSGSVFPLGPTNVRCVATNSDGERAEGGRYVFVADYGVPFVIVPDDIRVHATSAEGAHVEFTVTAEDTIDGEVPVTCEPKSGSLFPVGRTTVQCIAYDSSLNEGRGEFVVEVVQEKEILLLHLPDPIEAEATGPDGAVVTFEVTADGTSDPDPDVACDPKSGSVFPLGVTTVQCIATDSFGNRAEGSFPVTVRDTTGPMIVSVTATPDELVPNMKWVDVKIEVEVTDVVDPMPRCRVVDITTNQPGGGSEITGERSVRLLAERDPKLGDRTYDIRIECTDESQNVSESFATVRVPKGNGDDGSVEEPVTAPEEKKAIRLRW